MIFSDRGPMGLNLHAVSLLLAAFAVMLVAGSRPADAAGPPGPAYLHEGPILLENIRVIDGLGGPPLENRDVLVADGRIARISEHRKQERPPGLHVIDGAGRTVLPGLIDGHSHLLVNPFRGDPAEFHALEIWRPLPANLYAGVTTIFDIGSRLDPATDLRDAVAEGRIAGPTIHTVGDFFEEGTERNAFIGTQRLSRMDDYIALLDRHHEKGVTIIKTYVMMPLIRLTQLVDEARKRGMRVVVDNFAWMGSTAYIRAGVDGFAHVPYTHLLTGEEVEEAGRHGLWFIGTTAITRQIVEGQNRFLTEGPGSLDDPMVSNFYSRAELARMRKGEYSRNLLTVFLAAAKKAYGDRYFKKFYENFDNAISNIKALREKDILVGLGTDPLFPGMFHGEAMHYEMDLWSRGGVPNLAVIQSATYNNARILRIADQVGSVREGLLADLLVVDGNPAERIGDTRNIAAVIKGGKLVDRQALVLPKAP